MNRIKRTNPQQLPVFGPFPEWANPTLQGPLALLPDSLQRALLRINATIVKNNLFNLIDAPELNELGALEALQKDINRTPIFLRSPRTNQLIQCRTLQEFNQALNSFPPISREAYRLLCATCAQSGGAEALIQALYLVQQINPSFVLSSGGSRRVVVSLVSQNQLRVSQTAAFTIIDPNQNLLILPGRINVSIETDIPTTILPNDPNYPTIINLRYIPE